MAIATLPTYDQSPAASTPPGGGTPIGGSLGSADNVLVRTDGTGGSTIQGSGITLSDVASNNVTLSPIADTALTLATVSNNRNIVLAPHGTGIVQVTGTITAAQGNFTNGFNMTGDAAIDMFSRIKLYAASAGVLSIFDGSFAAPDRITLGPADNTSPAIRRSGTTLQARLGDNSADAPFTCANLTFGAASGAAGSRLLANGEHTSAPAAALATGQWEMTCFDNGSTPVIRFRYNDGGTTKVIDVGPLV